MEFLEKLLARPQRVHPLKAGSLSALAVDLRSGSWIDECADDLDTQEARVATSLLIRALWAADIIVTKIEAEKLVLAYFEGASRDVLLYETLHFCLHGISDELRRMLPPEVPGTKVYLSELAFRAAGALGRQHLGQFDVSGHRLERAKDYLRCAGNAKDMTQCLIDILLRARGRMSMDDAVEPADGDASIEVQISLRGIVHAAAAACILEGAEKSAARYADEFRPCRPSEVK